MSSVSQARQEPEVVRKVFGSGWGRYPAEIAEGAEVYWEGGKGLIGAVSQQMPWSIESVSLKKTPKK